MKNKLIKNYEYKVWCDIIKGKRGLTMKFKVIRAIIVAFVLMAAGMVYGATNTVIINGNSIQLETIEKDNRVFYPLRAICNELGITITEVTDRNIILERDGYGVVIARQDEIVANNQGSFIGPSAPIEKNNVTYIPIRTIGYMFGYDLSFKGKQLMITEQKDFIPPVGMNPSDKEMEEVREIVLYIRLSKEIDTLFSEEGMNILLEVKRTGKMNKLPSFIKKVKAYVQDIDRIIEGIENDAVRSYMRAAQDYLNASNELYICIYNKEFNNLEQIIAKGEKVADSYMKAANAVDELGKEMKEKLVYIQ